MSHLQKRHLSQPLGRGLTDDFRLEKHAKGKGKGTDRVVAHPVSEEPQEASPTSQTRTFHCFNSLAPEIRIAIWEAYFHDEFLPPPRVHDLMPYKCWHAECASKAPSPFGSEWRLERHIL